MPATTENHLHLSAIAPHIIQSEIRSMTVECDAVGGVNLAQGVCDTPLPKVVEEAAIQAIRDGYNIYTRMDGIAVRASDRNMRSTWCGVGRCAVLWRSNAVNCQSRRTHLTNLGTAKCISRG